MIAHRLISLTTLREFTIKLLHDIQCWKVSKLYWLIVDSHRWLRTFHVCNNHFWLSWEILLAHEKQKRTTIVVLNCLKELFIATSIQRHELKHMQETKFNYSTRFQVFYLFNIIKTYIVERVCTKAWWYTTMRKLQCWEVTLLKKLHCWRSLHVEKLARKLYWLMLNVLNIDECCERMLKTQMQSSFIKRTWSKFML